MSLERPLPESTPPGPPAPPAALLAESWRAALRSRSVAADAARVPRSTQAEPLLPRRRFIRAGFWTGVGVTLLGSAAATLDFLWPRGVRGFGGPVPAGHMDDIAPGADPAPFPEGQFWLVHLDPADTSESGGGGAGGLLALWRRCPHLGCSVPWNANAKPPKGFTDRDWFQCPCHGSTYTRAGVRVHGPAPRSMDTMRISIADDGLITVHTDQIQRGGPHNPSLAIPPEPGAETPELEA